MPLGIGASFSSPYLEQLGVMVEPTGARTVQWILETSTDSEMIFAAVRMIPEVEWAHQSDITDVLAQLKSHFFLCFDSTRQLLPLTQAQAVACLKQSIIYAWNGVKTVRFLSTTITYGLQTMSAYIKSPKTEVSTWSPVCKVILSN